MKKIFITLALLVLASLAFADSNPFEQKLPFKNATIKYEMKGSFKGTRTLYIKDHGKTRTEYSDATMKILGISNREKEITYTTPDWIYVYNEEDRVILKQTNPNKYMKEEYGKLSSADKKKFLKNMEASGVSTVESLNGTVEKAATKIMGYTCDKVTVAGITTYNITGTDITLKSEGSVMGIKENTVAVSIDKSKPSADKFNLPKGVPIEYSPEADEMAKEQAKSSIQMILESDGKSLITTDNSQIRNQAAEEDSGFDLEASKEKMKNMMKMFGGQE